MNRTQLKDQLGKAQQQFDRSASKLVDLMVLSPEDRDDDYEHAFAAARTSAHHGMLHETEILHRLYPETRPDEIERALDLRLQRYDDEIARSERFWSEIPACASPDGSFPSLNIEVLVAAPPPNRNDLDAERARLFFIRDAHSRPRLSRFYEMRQRERRMTVEHVGTKE